MDIDGTELSVSVNAPYSISDMIAINLGTDLDAAGVDLDMAVNLSLDISVGLSFDFTINLAGERARSISISTSSRSGPVSMPTTSTWARAMTRSAWGSARMRRAGTT